MLTVFNALKVKMSIQSQQLYPSLDLGDALVL
jgi:hypothetical protein